MKEQHAKAATRPTEKATMQFRIDGARVISETGFLNEGVTIEVTLEATMLNLSEVAQAVDGLGLPRLQAMLMHGAIEDAADDIQMLALRKIMHRVG